MDRERAPFLNDLATIDTIRTPKGEGHSKVVFVAGVSGVGKDTILSQVQKDFGNALGVDFIHGGATLVEKLGVIRVEVVSHTAEDLITEHNIILEKLLDSQPAVFNGHIMIKRSGLWVFDEEFFYALNPVQYVLLRGDPQIIYENRRKKNEEGSQIREVENEAIISAAQSRSIREADELTKRFQSGLSIINMQYGDDKDSRIASKANVAALAKVIKNVITD